MKNNNSSGHKFALYLEETTTLATSHRVDDLVSLKDPQLYHRIVHVLRLTGGESFILFDQKYHIQCQLLSIDKKTELHCKICSVHTNQIIKPHITFLLPLLKRDAFQEAVYSLTEIGVSLIIPVLTKQAQRSWGQSHEQERLEKIIHAAAEQSKHFSFPSLLPPQPVEQALSSLQPGDRIFFDPEGQPLLPLIQQINEGQPQHIVLMIGPEADLLSSEKLLLKEHNFTFCSLTQTILRAQQAAAVSLGIFRSILKN